MEGEGELRWDVLDLLLEANRGGKRIGEARVRPPSSSIYT